MRVKHYRLETDEKRYLLALLPINFGRLSDDRAVEAAIATEGFYMLALDDDAYVEADPYGWLNKDWDLVCAHFYLREKAKELRGGQVLRAAEVRAEVDHIVKKLACERGQVAETGMPDSDATARERGERADEWKS
ncbi:MAG: hypothetical protein AAB250_04195 [Bdellovibrionota bacterium]